MNITPSGTSCRTGGEARRNRTPERNATSSIAEYGHVTVATVLKFELWLCKMRMLHTSSKGVCCGARQFLPSKA